MNRFRLSIALTLLNAAMPNLAAIAQEPAVVNVTYGTPVQIATLADPEISESSGLAICRTRLNAFWTHNDSGDTARLFLIDKGGATLGIVQLDGVRAYDWEDMCSFQVDNVSYLLVGDVGDNRHSRKLLRLYLVREPDASRIGEMHKWKIQPEAMITYQLEDAPYDCEALAVDVQRRCILFACKSLGQPCKIYRLSLVLKTNPEPLTAKRIAEIDAPFVTAMDVADDGSRAIIVSYIAAYEYLRNPDEDWKSAFAKPGKLLRMPNRRQGESVCYGTDGRTLFLTTEGRDTPLWMVPGTIEPDRQQRIGNED